MAQKSKSNSKLIGCLALFLIVAAAVTFLIIYAQKSREQTENQNQSVTEGNNQDGGESSEDSGKDDEVDYSVLKAIDNQGVLDFMANKETGFLYAGRPTCPHCQVFAPILTSAVKNEKLEVFYYDTDAANSDKNKKSEALAVINVSSVPAFMYIKDGEIVANLSVTDSKDALLEFINQYK